MKEVPLKHVQSFSSEDPVHPAENLLKTAAGPSKWTCRSAGEKEAYVIFQLEKACEIHSIDVGNAGSAFVEILVSRSSDDYQVLVVASSLMTPSECKAWKNLTSVRMFNKENMSQAVADQKWDRVKVVCKQPFNKLEKFGLSFIRLRGPGESGNEGDTKSSSSNQEVTKFGRFSLRAESPSRSLGTTSLFSQRQAIQSDTLPKPSMAAQARDASAALMAQASTAQDQSASTGTRTQASNDKPASPATAKKERPSSHPVIAKQPSSHTGSSKHLAPVSTAGEGGKRKHEDPAKQRTRRSPSPTAQPAAKRPRAQHKARPKGAFEDMLKGVTFALSGFQNPLRGELRDKGLAMGADYRPQWGKGCTHLIAAFPNTPKYNQVKGHGIIVNHQWIEQCHSSGQRLSTKRYVFSTSDGSGSSSEDDRQPQSPQVARKRNPVVAGTSSSKGGASSTATVTKASSVSPSPSPAQQDMGDQAAAYDESTDDEMTVDKPQTSKAFPADEEDTDDEIERVRQEQAAVLARQQMSSSSSSDTEIDEDLQDGGSPYVPSDSDKPPLLPSFFSNLHFLLYGDFSSALRRQLVRYLTAYNGLVEDYMGDKVTHVITQSDWDSNFDRALADNSSLIFVKPTWVMACHDAQQCLPPGNHIIKKADN